MTQGPGSSCQQGRSPTLNPPPVDGGSGQAVGVSSSCGHTNGSKAPQDLAMGLRSSPKQIPCRFLYDARGSQLYEQITQLEEYYPFATEKWLLEAYAKDIIRHIPPGSVVTELGIGDAGKTGLLLEALLQREADGHEAVQFCGIDCSAEALGQAEYNLRQRCPQLDPSCLTLLEADYLEGLAQVRRQHPHAMLCLLWLGSSLGNLASDAAPGFLAELGAAAGERWQLLLCTDLWKDQRVLHDAYDDPAGVTAAFIKNGMRHALRVLGQPEEAADASNWAYEAVVNPQLQQVEMWLTARSAVRGVLPGVDIVAGEQVLMEISRKFTPPTIADIAHKAGLCVEASWGGATYRMQLLLPPREAMLRCWQDTDSLFASITDWQAQPIGLRHPFCFYYGHHAAFARLKLLPQEEGCALDITLSRGVDPNVLDPSKCHSHPALPTCWPSQQCLRDYVDKIRAKLLGCLDKPGTGTMHAVCMSLEHERMHQETLCHMVAQQRKQDYLLHARSAGGGASAAPMPTIQLGTVPCTLQPFYLQGCTYHSPSMAALATASPGTPVSRSDWAAPASTSPGLGSCAAQQNGGDTGSQGHGGSVPAAAPQSTEVVPGAGQACDAGGEECGEEEWVVVPAATVRLGLGEGAGGGFVWDNERGEEGPIQVPHFRLAAHPVSVRQFREFVVQARGYERPELWDAADLAWLTSSGQTMPPTWSMGGTEGDIVVHMPEASYPWMQVASCPAYVSLAEALAYCREHSARIMTEAEYAAACHHADAAAGGTGVVGLREGGWEWCSTELVPFAGFSADELYPEYSADFFDGCHYVLKGSSPYTHPSMRRDSFRNFYQRQYPYVFAKFRMARQAE